jgi:DNA-directed RNA polymerase subunit F
MEMPTGLEHAKQLLENYAKGRPLASEAATFPQIVEQVKKTDPQKAKILEEGFADLQRSPRDLRTKAQALLKRL